MYLLESNNAFLEQDQLANNTTQAQTIPAPPPEMGSAGREGCPAIAIERSFLDIDRKTFSRYRRKDVCRPSVTFVDAGGLGGIRKNLPYVLNRVYSIETKADRK